MNVPTEIWADIIKLTNNIKLKQVCKTLNNIISTDAYGSFTSILEYIVPTIPFDKLPIMIIRKMAGNFGVMKESFLHNDIWTKYKFDKDSSQCGYRRIVGGRGIITNQKQFDPVVMCHTKLIVNYYELMVNNLYHGIKMLWTPTQKYYKCDGDYIIELFSYCAYINDGNLCQNIWNHFIIGKDLNYWISIVYELIECFVQHNNLDMLKLVCSYKDHEQYMRDWLSNIKIWIVEIAIVTKSKIVFDHYISAIDECKNGMFYALLVSSIEYDNFDAFYALLKTKEAKKKILNLNKNKSITLERSCKCNSQFYLEFLKFMKKA